MIILTGKVSISCCSTTKPLFLDNGLCVFDISPVLNCKSPLHCQNRLRDTILSYILLQLITRGLGQAPPDCGHGEQYHEQSQYHTTYNVMHGT